LLFIVRGAGEGASWKKIQDERDFASPLRGLRFFLDPHPVLKRWANLRCAYGAGSPKAGCMRAHPRLVVEA